MRSNSESEQGTTISSLAKERSQLNKDYRDLELSTMKLVEKLEFRGLDPIFV